MKSFQEILFKDFDVKKEVQKHGKVKRTYVYVGDYAAWNLKDEELLRYKRLYVSATVLLCLLFIWSALQRVPLNSARLPGGFLLLCLVSLLPIVMGVWQFVTAPKKMYKRDCLRMKDLVLWGSILYLIFRVCGTVTGIPVLVSEGVTLLSVVVFIAGILTAGLALVLFLAQRKLKYLEIPG